MGVTTSPQTLNNPELACSWKWFTMQRLCLAYSSKPLLFIITLPVLHKDIPFLYFPLLFSTYIWAEYFNMLATLFLRVLPVVSFSYLVSVLNQVLEYFCLSLYLI